MFCVKNSNLAKPAYTRCQLKMSRKTWLSVGMEDLKARVSTTKSNNTCIDRTSSTTEQLSFVEDNPRLIHATKSGSIFKNEWWCYLAPRCGDRAASCTTKTHGMGETCTFEH